MTRSFMLKPVVEQGGHLSYGRTGGVVMVEQGE